MSLSWSTRRKLIYIGLLAVPAVLLGGYLIWQFYQPPGCFDGEQNQDERGIDCGGSCERVCQDLTQSAGARWARSFNVSGSVYNSVAFIENPNVNLRAENVPYEFTVHGGPEGRIVAQREGAVDIPPRSVFAVFEPSIDTGGTEVRRTTFQFLEAPFWEEENTEEPKPQVAQTRLQKLRTDPRVDVVVRNPSLDTMKEVELVVILFSDDGNAVHTSRTVISEIQSESARNAVFTWPKAFSENVVRATVIPTEYKVVD